VDLDLQDFANLHAEADVFCTGSSGKHSGNARPFGASRMRAP
jgi:hypothetical protein